MKTQQNTPRQQEYLASQKNNIIPLMKIAEAKVQIFSDCIILQDEIFYQAKTADTGEFASFADDAKMQQISKQQQKQKYAKYGIQKHKVIMFSNPDFAFNIEQHGKTVEIHDLVNHNIVLKFKVNQLQTLLTIQSLLRRKMCELGFENKYKITKKLGKGATAEVHLVERISDKKLFAAKIISIKQANDKSYQTFINESKLLRILKHKNIISLESLYVHKKQLIQVMQYLEGGTLLQLVKNDQITNRKQKWRILRDITFALDHMRQRRIVHRDIKMENILVRKIGDQRQYVVSDFGLACWTGQKNPIFERCGTPGYIAPEVLNAPKGKPILNHKIDIFSLGVIAHILFLHQPLFAYTGNVKQLLKSNKKAEYNLEGYIYQDLTLTQINFLQLTLDKNPEERATSQQLIQQIKYITNPAIQLTPQKSVRHQKSLQKIKIDDKALGVEVKVSKPTSLTKAKINMSSSKNEKSGSADKIKQKQKEQKPESGSARRLLSDFWLSLTSPSPRKQKKQTIKIKQNSIEKHKKMTQYLD